MDFFTWIKTLIGGLFVGSAVLGGPGGSAPSVWVPSATNLPEYVITTVSDGCAEWASNILTTTGTACGEGSSTTVVSTSTNETAGRLSYWTTTSGTPAKLGAVATTTLSGTANQISLSNSPIVIGSSGAVLTLPSHVIFPGNFQATNATTTNATSTHHDITDTLTFDGVTGATWSEFCQAITGDPGLCDASDDNTTYTGGDHLTLTGNDFDVDDDFLLNTGDTGTGNYTLSYASTTGFSSGYASSTLYYGAGLADCHTGNMLTWLAGQFGCEDDTEGVEGGGLTSYDAWTHPSAGVSATTSSMIFHNASSTFTGGLNSLYATTTGLYVTELTASRAIFTDADKRLTTTGTVGAIEAAVGSQNILLETEVDACSELAALLDQETGGCGAGVGPVFSDAPTFTGLTALANASSTLFSTGYASSTLWYGGGLLSTCASGSFLTWTAGQFGCDTDDVGAGVDGYDFSYIQDIGFGVTGSATTTKTQFTLGLHASSTSQFDNATSTLLTATTAWLTNLFIGADTIAEYISDTAGAMWTGNTETGISITYQDADNTIDAVVSGLVSSMFSDADWGEGSVASGVFTVDDDVIGDEHFKDDDWGQVSISSGVATVEDITCTDCLNATEIEDIYLLDDGDVGTGVFDFGGATSVEIPNGGPTVDTTGEVGIDTTSGQFKWSYNGSSLGIKLPYEDFGFTYSTTTWTGTTTIELPSFFNAATVSQAYCRTTTGTVGMSLYDGTNRALYMATASTTQNLFTYTSSNNSFTAGENVAVDIGTPASSPVKIVCNFKYTYDAD